MRLNTLPTCLFAIVAMNTFGSVGFSATQTVNLPVQMSCPMSDPPTYEELISNIPGVHSVEMDYDMQIAIVTYEDTEIEMSDIMATITEFAHEIGARTGSAMNRVEDDPNDM